MDMAICCKGCLQSVAIYTFDLKGTRNMSQKKNNHKKEEEIYHWDGVMDR